MKPPTISPAVTGRDSSVGLVFHCDVSRLVTTLLQALCAATRQITLLAFCWGAGLTNVYAATDRFNKDKGPLHLMVASRMAIVLLRSEYEVCDVHPHVV
jgi:hypothetical protein